MDFYSRNYADSNPKVVGVTTFWDSNERQIYDNDYGRTNHRHTYAKIILSSAYKQQEYFDAMIRHEMGHAFGMAHSANKWSIMYKNDSLQVRTVQKVDSDKLIDLYGWNW